MADFKITALDEVDSTNAELKRRAAAGAEEYTVITAARQSAGRGTHGRSFFSPEGGLYMSVLLKPRLDIRDAVFITTAAAVAAARAAEKVFSEKIGIKWVNDLYLDEKKVCGILTEASQYPDGRLRYAVLGLGFNIFPPACGMPEELRGKAGFLCPKDPGGDARTRLTAQVLSELEPLVSALPDISFRAEYESRLTLKGRRVSALVGGREQTARVLGVDERMRLLLEYDDGHAGVLSSAEGGVTLLLDGGDAENKNG